MVLPAVLRDPALDPEQAPGRDRAVLLDHHPRVPALARHLAGEVGDLPAALQAVLLAVRRGLHRTGLARLEAAGRRLCGDLAPAHGLVLHPLPRGAAAARPVRDAAAGAELDLGGGAQEG